MSIPVNSPDDAIARARSVLNKGIAYKLGKGGVKPQLETPAPAGQCDCTGYIAWALGISRVLDNPYYKQLNGGWFETTAIYKDIASPLGIFTQLDTPRVGAVVVYGDSGNSEGHIGLITEVSQGKIKKVIHCSSSAWNTHQDAIAENAPKVFTENSSVRYGWFSGYSDAELISLDPVPLSAGDIATVDATDIQVLFTVGNPPKYTAWHYPGEHAFFYQSHATINADGAPNAYHPKDTGIDWLMNAGRPTRKGTNGKWDQTQPHSEWLWWGISVDGSNRPYTQTAAQPFPGYYISTTALVNGSAAENDPARYVDSNQIPFFVLPRGQFGGAKKGDIGWIINRANGKATGAIFADIGPKDKLGEVSIAAATRLGFDKTSPKNGGVSKKEILYLVFPGSGTGKPQSAKDIQSQAHALFTQWGGDGRVASLPPLL